jgi:hypothetical protein
VLEESCGWSCLVDGEELGDELDDDGEEARPASGGLYACRARVSTAASNATAKIRTVR